MINVGKNEVGEDELFDRIDRINPSNSFHLLLCPLSKYPKTNFYSVLSRVGEL